jgi:hypothetical protein
VANDASLREVYTGKMWFSTDSRLGYPEKPTIHRAGGCFSPFVTVFGSNVVRGVLFQAFSGLFDEIENAEGFVWGRGGAGASKRRKILGCETLAQTGFDVKPFPPAIENQTAGFSVGALGAAIGKRHLVAEASASDFQAVCVSVCHGTDCNAVGRTEQEEGWKIVC